MQHTELLNYENLTLRTVEKMAVFAVPTFVLKSHGKTEFVSRTHSRSLHAYASICLLAYSWLSHPEVHLFF